MRQLDKSEMASFTNASATAERNRVAMAKYGGWILEPKDMPGNLRVRLNKSDVAIGKKSDCHECPFALATIRALIALGYDVVSVSVGPVTTFIGVVKDGAFGYYAYRGTPTMGKWIWDFDHSTYSSAMRMKLIKTTLRLADLWRLADL